MTASIRRRQAPRRQTGVKQKRKRTASRKSRHRKTAFGPGKRLWAKLAACTLLMAGVLLSAVLIHYYGKFNRLIDAHLTNQTPDGAVYARPLQIRVHQAISMTEWIGSLRAMGYRQNGQSNHDHWFESTPGTLNIGQREASGQVNLRIRFREGRIDAILKNGKPVRQAQTRPPFLSSLFDQTREKRKYVAFDEIPDHVVKAVLAAEDKDFFDHPGVSPTGFLRAVVVNLIHWGRHQGGSTLTQQFIKNYFLTPDKQFRRKFEEILFAILLERRLSKPQILELYTNEVYLGQLGSFAILGLGQGASVYFGKHIQELTLNEAATLAGIIQAPNRHSPYEHPDDVLIRRNFVLDQMERESFISTRENALARRQPLAVRPVSTQNYSEAPYFIDHIRKSLRDEYGLTEASSRHVRVYSTLDPALQKAAFEAVQKGLAEVDDRVARRKEIPKPQAALIALDPQTGEILALVGGRDYASAQYNRATVAMRQPGSSFKPFIYAAALQSSLDSGPPLTLTSRLADEPHTFYFENGSYSPRNFGDSYRGSVSLRQALAYSLNVPTVLLAEQTGFPLIRQSAIQLGFNEQLQPYPSIALGSFEVSLLELVQAYQVLANRGRLLPLKAIREVRGKDGSVSPSDAGKARRVFSPQITFLVTSALQSVLDEGTGQAARKLGFDFPAAGKTGSTEDSWFIGYTPDLLCGVWVGTDQPPVLDLTGAQAALPIWTEFMLRAKQIGRLSGEDFSRPTGITAAEVDPRSGLLASGSCESTRVEYFMTGTEPTSRCRKHEAPSLQDQPKKKKKGRWNWLTKIFRRNR